ncbi:MAG: DUF1788 domain-containing protein [Sandaracinus sp.]|nr:DUF1788 domain-containing protein [Sandaracinus sp.]MCB9635205.1 DUF1788 domain-containing protein [Sandaracinus sp.]
MTDLFHTSELQRAFGSLRADLVHEDGPRISTMRNYRFAILQYEPKDEHKLRAELQKLSTDLVAHGWVVHSLDLHRLFLDRVQREGGEEFVQRVIAMEKATAARDAARGLQYLQDKLAPLIEGPNGLAKDVADLLHDFATKNPDRVDRTVAFLGRAGALYPFFRTSALLRHLDGRTGQIPVVLLYPGHRLGNGLSFMGVLDPDSDYRPRIYP